MRISATEHAQHRWRLTEIAPDFELIDAWELPAEGGLGDFVDLRRVWSQSISEENRDGPVKALFAAREWLGGKFGWDENVNGEPIPGTTERSVADRLPADLAERTHDEYERPPFRTLYVTDTESAAELSNSLVHAVLHLGWANVHDDIYRGYLGVYVKHRGRLGQTYMTAIAPFRHYLVYPALMKRIERNWSSRRGRTRDPAGYVP